GLDIHAVAGTAERAIPRRGGDRGGQTVVAVGGDDPFRVGLLSRAVKLVVMVHRARMHRIAGEVRLTGGYHPAQVVVSRICQDSGAVDFTVLGLAQRPAIDIVIDAAVRIAQLHRVHGIGRETATGRRTPYGVAGRAIGDEDRGHGPVILLFLAAKSVVREEALYAVGICHGGGLAHSFIVAIEGSDVPQGIREVEDEVAVRGIGRGRRAGRGAVVLILAQGAIATRRHTLGCADGDG